jgi:hypothetical protein
MGADYIFTRKCGADCFGPLGPTPAKDSRWTFLLFEAPLLIAHFSGVQARAMRHPHVSFCFRNRHIRACFIPVLWYVRL